MDAVIGFAIGVAVLAILLMATVILGYIGKIDWAILTGSAVITGIIPQIAPLIVIVAIILLIIGNAKFGVAAIIGGIVGIGIVAGTLAMVGVDFGTLSLTSNYWQEILNAVWPPAN